MQKYRIIILCALPLLLAPAAADDADAILGVWVTAAKDGYVEITKNRNMFNGTIVGGPNPEDTDRLDDNNPNPALRDRALLNLEILKGFTYAGGHEWTGGTIYDPNNGKTYNCLLELKDEDRLEVRGYVGIPLFGRSEIWTRKQEGG